VSNYLTEELFIKVFFF